jgi:DNA-binding NarL/FixJ family response regulator
MIKVAIVEDNTKLRTLWTDVLNNTEGYVCVGSYGNTADAIKYLPTVFADVVLTDIQLSPTESGIDIVQKIKTQCVDSQFLMFTISENEEHIFNALKAGATGYILKNTSPTKVLDAIAELHAGGSPMSAAIARRVLFSFHKKGDPSVSDPKNELNLKENQLLELLSKGLFYKEIAPQMNTTVGTIKQSLHDIYQKLHVSNRTEAVNKYLKR